MKKFPKLVQVDKRGQIVIPKDMRKELGIEEGTGFWMFSIEDEGILLKKVETPDFKDNITKEIEDKSDKIGIDKNKIKVTNEKYRQGKGGRLDVI